MDTPQRAKPLAATPVSKIEDSPVFSFISSLSPIRPVKSMHITHAVPLNFSYPPPVFASPETGIQKERNPSIRFLPSDSLRPDFLKHSECGIDENANHKIRSSLKTDAVDSSEKFQNLPSCLSGSSDYKCGSPDHNTNACSRSTIDLNRVRVNLSDFACDAEEIVGSSLNHSKNEDRHHGLNNMEDVPASDWANLINDVSVNLLGSQKIKVEGSCHSSSFSLGICEDEASLRMRNHYGQRHVLTRDNHDHEMQVPSSSQSNQEDFNNFQSRDNEPENHDILGFEECQHQRGFRRRCLVFDATSHTIGRSVDDSSASLSEEKPQSSSKHSSVSSLQMLPGIGLHLNSLAVSLKVRIEVEDSSSSGRKLLSLPCSSGPISSMAPVQRVENVFLTKDQELRSITGEDEGPSSPKNKKCKVESNAESGTCRRCNCKKSKCLKLYCECFAAGVYCDGPCACEGCLNKPIHEHIVLATRKQIESRNPLAFAPKVIRATSTASGTGEDVNKTPASARHKRGCNCKKSGCLKKYCECFQSGVGCSASCRCEGCKNCFGRREEAGCVSLATKETEVKEVQMDLCSVSQPKLSLPVTPSFHTSRPLEPSGLSPLLNACAKTHKSPLRLMAGDESTPVHLRETPFSVKTSSPNGKRVLPPRQEIGRSPSKKGGRRLILKSIPAFPSLHIISKD